MIETQFQTVSTSVRPWYEPLEGVAGPEVSEDCELVTVPASESWRFIPVETRAATSPRVLARVTRYSDLESSERSLNEYSRWYGYVASRIADLSERSETREAIATEALQCTWNTVRTLLHRNAATPSVLPGSDGGVVLVWHKKGWDVEVEVEPAGEVAVWAQNPLTGDMFSGAVEDYRDELRDVIALLSAD